MQKKLLQDGIELYFPKEERETAEVVEAACGRSVVFIRETWGLPPPKRCRVYVMTSGLRFMFQSAPWYAWALGLPLLLLLRYMWILFVVVVLFLFLRIQKVWKFSAGWTLPYKGNPTIGIKPPRLLAQSDQSIGKMIFIEERDLDKRIAHTVCHELTHAFSASLRLPLWLNEGIAMLTVDRLMGYPTVRGETLRTLNLPRLKRSVGRYENLARMSKEAVIYHYVRGYWLTRFLRDTQPELLNELLVKRHPRRSLEKKVAAALGVKPRLLWKTIDERIVEHFGDNQMSSEPLGGGNVRQPPRSDCIH